jgi:8-oxo-dGTP pyrophosphatase MutT (NUDIX family)
MRSLDTLEQLERALAPSDQVPDAPSAEVRDAAVAVIFRITPVDALELLMIERASYAGDPWSGHIAFPGGRREPSDATLLATALRETREETGIDLSVSGRVFGALTRLHPTSRALPPLSIAPFVALLTRDTPLALSEEVAGAFWVPLSALQRTGASSSVDVTVGGGRRTVRAFVHERYTIWGLTERIIGDLLSRLTG